MTYSYANQINYISILTKHYRFRSTDSLTSIVVRHLVYDGTDPLKNKQLVDTH